MSGDDQWGVWIDEVGILATGRGSNWWVEQSVRMQSSGVLIDLDMVPIAGGVYLMRCTSEEEATFAAEHIAEHVHGKFAKPMTLASARKKIRTQHAKRRGHGGCVWCRPEEPTR